MEWMASYASTLQTCTLSHLRFSCCGSLCVHTVAELLTDSGWGSGCESSLWNVKQSKAGRKGADCWAHFPFDKQQEQGDIKSRLQGAAECSQCSQYSRSERLWSLSAIRGWINPNPTAARSRSELLSVWILAASVDRWGNSSLIDNYWTSGRPASPWQGLNKLAWATSCLISKDLNLASISFLSC